MKKLFLIRGHSGSGKTTFAKQKLAEYPDSIHLENDLFMVENGKYVWTKERCAKAAMMTWEAFKQSVENGVQAIAVCNIFANPKRLERFKNFAEKHGYDVEIYRAQNWFDNTHGVDFSKVATMYAQIEQNPIEGEILLPIHQPISPHVAKFVEQLGNI